MNAILGFALVLSWAGLVHAGDAAQKPDSAQKDKVQAAGIRAGGTADSSAATLDTSAHKYIAYYFHGTRRCPSCIKIEAYTKEAVDSGFVKSLQSGLLEWRVVNTDESENEHFLKEYQLFTKSVVLVDLRGGKQVKWTNLAKVWDFLGDKPAFVKYIQDELTAFMKAD